MQPCRSEHLSMPSRRPRRSALARGRSAGVLVLSVLLLLGFAVPASAAPGDALTVSLGTSLGGGDPTTVAFDVGDGTAACSVTGPGLAVASEPCAPGWSTPAFPQDGSYAVGVVVTGADVTTTDPVTGGETTEPGPTTSGSATYVRDTTPPVVTLTAPSGPDYASSTGWQLGVEDLTATTVTCRLEEVVAGERIDAGPVDCGPGAVKPALAPGRSYVLVATATDARQQATSEEAASDVNAPTVTVTPVDGQGPTGSGRSVGWEFVVPDTTATVSCSLAGPGAPAGSTCATTGTYTATGLSAPGVYTLTITATDPSGNVGQGTGTYELDLTGPTLELQLSGPATGPDPTAYWWVGLGDADPATAVCTLDGVEVACDPTITTPALADDESSTLVVTASDAYGNPSGPVSSTYTRQATPSAPTVTVTPTASTDVVRPTWTIAVDDLATGVTCTLTGPSGTTDPVCAAGPFTPGADLTEGEWTLSVVASSADGGPSSTGSATYVLDSSEPVGPDLTAVHDGTSGNASPLSWTFDVDPGRTAECSTTLAGVAGAFVECGSPQTITPTDDGAYGLAVRYVDALENTGEPSTATYDYDGTAPGAPTLGRTPTGAVLQPGDVEWTVTAATGEATAGYTCELTGDAGPTACTFPLTRTLDAGGWTLSVRALDAAGNASEPAVDTFTVDGDAPAAPDVIGDEGRGIKSPLVWQVTSSDPDTATLACRLLTDGTTDDDYAPCAASYPVTESGTYRLDAVARDAAGNQSDPTLGPEYELDVTGPVAPEVTIADAIDNLESATWVVTAAEPGLVECRVDGPTGVQQDWTECGGLTTVQLTQDEGTYSLVARSTDLLDNVGDVSEPVDYVLDLTAPAPASTPVLVPARTTGNATTVVWTWTGTADTTECSLQQGTSAGVFTDCAAGDGVVLGDDDEYRLQVVLVDEHGNRSEAAVSEPYLLDTEAPDAPEVLIQDGRAGTTDDVRDLVFTFSGDGEAVCQLYEGDALVGDPVPDCGSPYPVQLPDESGEYSLGVTYTDAAENAGDEGRSDTYVLDVDGPAAPTVTIADAVDNVLSATWEVTADEPGLLECRVDGPDGEVQDWTECAGETTVPLPAVEGVYALTARSSDLPGNLGAESQPVGYELDLTAPAAPGTPVLVPARDLDNEPAVVWTWTGTAPDAECTLLGGTLPAVLDACVSGQTVDLPGEGTWSLQVVLLDEHGNRSDPATSAYYVLDTTEPLEPVVTVEGGLDGTTDDVRDVGYSFSGDGTATCQLYRSGAAVGVPDVGCEAPYGVVLPDESGPYQLGVTYEDAAGNVGDEGRSGTYTLDVDDPAAPIVTVDPDAGPLATATWTVSPVEALATVECALRYTPAVGPEVAPALGTCEPGYAYDLTSGDGTYVLEVRLTDRYGNAGEPVLGEPYLLDSEGPDAPTVTGDRDDTLDHELTVTWTLTGVPSDADDAVCTVQLVDGSTVTAVEDLGDCRTGATTDLPEVNGAYRLAVVLLDVYDNESAVAWSGTYDLDVVDPGQPTVVGDLDDETDDVRTYDYVFSAEEGTATCVLLRSGAVYATTADCTSPLTVTLPATPAEVSTWRLEVTYTDDAGNTGLTGVSGDYVLDLEPPADPTVTVDPRTDDVEQVTWTVTPRETGTTSTCRLRYTDLLGATTVPTAFTSCAAPYTYDLTSGDGRYALEVLLTDAVGNPGTAVVGEDYLLDTTAPVRPDVAGPTGPSKDTAVAWTWTTEAGATSGCRLLQTTGTTTTDVTPTGMPCASGATVTLPSTSASYAFEVVVTDAVGNPSDPGTSDPYVLDVTPPAAPVASTTAVSPSKVRTVVWTFTVEKDATCRVALRTGTAPAYTYTSSDAFLPCTSPHTTVLPDVSGDYVLEVVDTDAVGNASPVGRSAAYLLDVTKPVTPTPSGPPATGNARTVTWSFPGEGTATCELLLEGASQGAPVACGPTYAPTLTTDGAWRLVVVRTDAVGNVSDPGTSAAYLLDTVLPTAPVVSAPSPAGPSQVRSPSWSVSGEAGALLECRLVSGSTEVYGWAACPGGTSLQGRPDGAYLLQARATDAARNVSATGSSPSAYVLDTTAPTAAVVSGPNGPSSVRTPRFTWTGEPGTTATCQLALDGATSGGPVPCSSGFTPSLPTDGSWTVTVVLTDTALNSGPPASSGGYLLDTTPPPAPGVVAPASPGRDLAPTWGVGAEGGARLECRLTPPSGTAPAWTPCPSPLVTPLTGLPDGRYLLEVRATDAAGNVSATGSAAYVLDTAPPAAAVVTGPAGPARDTSPSYSFTTEAGASTRCRTTSGADGPVGLRAVHEPRPDGPRRAARRHVHADRPRGRRRRQPRAGRRGDVRPGHDGARRLRCSPPCRPRPTRPGG